MRIAFLGNGPFAVPALRKLVEAGRSPVVVVARPDLPQGKHQLLEAGPMKQAATELQIPVVQPPDVNDPSAIAELASLQLDLLVVADFGQILSRDCLAVARLGGINIHGSLLPAYRGAAPVAWAMLNGERESGVSIIQMTSRLDAGGVIAQQSLRIERSWTAGDLESRLAEIGAGLALKAIDSLEKGTATPIAQDDRQASKAPKLKKENGQIDWSKPASAIYDHIRAMQPWPVAFTNLLREGKPSIRVQVLQALDPLTSDTLDSLGTTKFNEIPGQIVDVGNTLNIQTGSGILQIERLKPAGKNTMDIPTFCRGNPVQPGDRLA